MRLRVLSILAAIGAGALLTRCSVPKKEDTLGKPTTPSIHQPMSFYVGAPIVEREKCVRPLIAYEVVKRNGFKASPQADFLLGEITFPISAVYHFALLQLINEFNRAISFIESKNELKGRYTKEALLEALRDGKRLMEKAKRAGKPLLFNCRAMPADFPVRPIKTGWQPVDKAKVADLLTKFGLNNSNIPPRRYLEANILASRFPTGAKALVIIAFDDHESFKAHTSIVKILQTLSHERWPIYYGLERSPSFVVKTLKDLQNKTIKTWFYKLIDKILKPPGGSLYALLKTIERFCRDNNGFDSCMKNTKKFRVSSYSLPVAHYLLGKKLNIFGVEDTKLHQKQIKIVEKLENGSRKWESKKAFKREVIYNSDLAIERGIKNTQNFAAQLTEVLRKKGSANIGPVGLMSIGIFHAREVYETFGTGQMGRDIAQIYAFSESPLKSAIELH